LRLSALCPLIVRSMSKQGVDPADRFQRQRRDDCWGLALSFTTRVLGQIGHNEERASGVDPTGRFEDRARRAAGLVQFAVAAVGVSLEDTGVVG
jgi:hypothetical protein